MKAAFHEQLMRSSTATCQVPKGAEGRISRQCEYLRRSRLFLALLHKSEALGFRLIRHSLPDLTRRATLQSDPFTRASVNLSKFYRHFRVTFHVALGRRGTLVPEVEHLVPHLRWLRSSQQSSANRVTIERSGNFAAHSFLAHHRTE